MSLSGADETPEFASRITYEAREALAKDEASQLPRAISTATTTTSTSTTKTKTTNTAPLVRAPSTWHDEKESFAARDLNPPKAGRRCALMSRATIMETTAWLSTHNGPTGSPLVILSGQSMSRENLYRLLL